MRLPYLASVFFSSVLFASSAIAAGGLMTCGKCIGTTIVSAAGVGSTNARVESRVTQDDILLFCDRDGDDRRNECIAQAERHDLDTRLSATANCPAGELVNVDGARFDVVGRWGPDEPSGVAEGAPKFADRDGRVASTTHAGGGRELATNWRLLCGEDRTDGPLLASSSANDRVLGEPFDHNGSTMTVDFHAGVIVYAEPRSGLRQSIAPGTVLFRGDMSNPRNVRGTAYVFRVGCRPEPYPVVGRFADGFASTLVLTGAAPVRAKSGCTVTGHSDGSPNARLVFEYVSPPEL